MYSIISVNGHQYKVKVGDKVVVDKMEMMENSTASFPSLLFVDGKTVKVGKQAAGVQVNAKVVKHFKGAKIDVARFKAKSRFRRHVGFRPQLTELKIEQIGVQDKKESHLKAVIRTPTKTKSGSQIKPSF